MQIAGPQQVVFADGSGQAPLTIAATGQTGTVTYSVTEIPAQVAAVRKTAAGAPLAVGAALTESEAASLVVTRTANAGTGPSVSRAAIVGMRTRVFASGTTAPAFTVATAEQVNGAKAGNLWISNFPTGGTGTLTVDILFDTGAPIILAAINNFLMQLGYSSDTMPSWTGVAARAISSSNGTALTLLNVLTGTAAASNPNVTRQFSGAVTGAPSTRWFGVRLTAVPRRYPMIFFDFAAATATTGGFTALPTPVFFAVQGQDGSGGSAIAQSAIVGVRSRVYATGGTAPAFTVGGTAEVDAVRTGNFWLPNLNPAGTGTLTVELLFDYGTAITLGQISELMMQLDYSSATSPAWTGVVAKAIASTNGTTLSVLNTLTGLDDPAIPNARRRFSGAVTGAPLARYFGIQLTVVPRKQPLIFNVFAGSTMGSSTASLRVPIGDTTTNFGSGTGGGTGGGGTGGGSTLSVTGGPIVRMGGQETTKLLGLSVTGGTAPYTIVLNTTGMVAPLTLAKTATGAALSGANVALTLTELQALVAKRSTRTEFTPGVAFAINDAIAIRSERNGATTALSAAMLDAFKNQNFFGQAGGAATTSSGFVVEMPAPVQVGDVQNIPLRYGYGDTVPAGTVVEFLRSTDGATLTVASTIALPAKGNDGNYTITATIANPVAAKFWGFRFKFPAATTSNGIGFYSGGTPRLFAPATPYQVPNAITSPSTAVLSVTDAAGATASLNLKIGGGETVVVEAPGASEPAFIELQERVGSTWTGRGTLALTGRIGDIAPDSGMKFEGTNGAVWVSDPASTLPTMGDYEAWGVRFGCGPTAARKYSYCVGLKPKSAVWPTYPFGNVQEAGRQTVPSQLHRWVVKTVSGAVVEVMDWNGNPINDPAKSPKQFWGTDPAGNLNTASLRPYHIGQGVVGWQSAPSVRANAAALFPKMDTPLEWPFRDPGVTNPMDYSITVFQKLGLYNIYGMEADGVVIGQFSGTSEDPEMQVGSSRFLSTSAYGYRYRPGQTSGRDVTTGPGGIRVVDRSIMGDPFAQVVHNPAAVRLHRNTPWVTIAREVAKSYASENCFHITNARMPKPLPMTIGGAPSHGRFYYGTGNLNDPQTLDLNSGRADAINGQNGQYAADKKDPSGWLYWSGQVPDYEHNYPFAALGALVFESPAHWWMAQFHFLQSSMVMDRIGYLTSSTPGSWLLRPNAWPFANAAYIWAVQDSNHPMAAVTRDQLEQKLKAELIKIADEEIPFLNADPVDLDDVGDYNRALIKRFGGMGSGFTKVGGANYLPIGYLAQGLALWKKFGLWDRMRSLDPRCATALDYILSRIAKASVDLLIDAPYILAQQHDGYGNAAIQPNVWPTEVSGVALSSLPQNWAQWAAQNPANGASFWERAPGAYVYSSGQYHVLHCVTMLKRVFGYSYPRLDQAETQARQLMASRVAAIRALPAGQKASHMAHMQVCQGLIATTETGGVTQF